MLIEGFETFFIDGKYIDNKPIYLTSANSEFVANPLFQLVLVVM